MHELTEKVFRIPASEYNLTLDKIICEWLKEKAKKLNQTGYSHAYVKQILGLTDKSLEEKLRGVIHYNECGINEVARVAKQHFKENIGELDED